MSAATHRERLLTVQLFAYWERCWQKQAEKYNLGTQLLDSRHFRSVDVKDHIDVITPVLLVNSDAMYLIKPSPGRIEC